MSTTTDTLDERDTAPPLADVAPEPTPAPPTTQPVDVPLGPPADGLRPAVRAMVAELAAHYKGADPGSVAKAIKAMRPDPTTPSPWGSQGMAGEAVKVYRATIGGTPAKPAEKKPAVRTAPAKPRRTVERPATPEPVRTAPVPPPVPQPAAVVQPEPVPQPEPAVRTAPVRRAAVWPVVLLAAPAFVAVWSGWVGLGKLTGFGMVDLLPGIVKPGSWATIDSAITLPIGVETYAAYALYVWLSGRVPDRARRFARWSAIGSLVVGALGQVAYHQMVAAGITVAPWQITTAVACLPVAVLGMGAALAHLVREEA